MTLSATPVNLKKIGRMMRLLAKGLAHVLQRGFFGALSIRVVVQDGTIQSIRLRLDEIEK